VCILQECFLLGWGGGEGMGGGRRSEKKVLRRKMKGMEERENKKGK
jgi:hypothetical protein